MIHLKTILYKALTKSVNNMGCCQSGQQIHPTNLKILLETESIYSDASIENVIKQVTMESKDETSKNVRGERI